MRKTAYGVSSIIKEYYKSITFKNNKNTSGNIEIITGLVL